MKTLMSPWGENINTKRPLPEYPRMYLQRDSYYPLNGEWEYQIVKDGEEISNDNWKRIIVPFAIGSKLSLAEDKTLGVDETLYYRKKFKNTLTNNRVILNFEAVDQEAIVYLNGILVGEHYGGYAPFMLDVTSSIKVDNELIVIVKDYSDSGIYAYGKQKIEHGGMWYTPSSGIWQSVWLEEVPEERINDIKITVDYDHQSVYLSMTGEFSQAVITVFEGKKLVHRGITSEENYMFTLDEVHSWSLDDPFLYDFYIATRDETLKSYFGMRKFSRGKDKRGIERFFLNNQLIFLSGLLDQGYTVDGLLTYASEDALIYELTKIKEMGFNMLRVHAKVESRRFYYLCDKLGLLIMQDMPNGGGPYDFKFVGIKPNLGLKKANDHNYKLFARSSEKSRDMYYLELGCMLDNLYNFTCIFAWVPFNEGWGQFDSKEVTDYIKDYDSTRLVDSASGWYDQGAGDFNSIHNYFFPFRVPKKDGRIILLSEFGGYSYLEKEHSEAEKVYGYRKFKDRLALNEAIQKLYKKAIIPNIPKGLSGCIYTQVSDVQDECNGLFTEDRKMIKIDMKKMKKINEICSRMIK